jgi:hypothetical protein
VTYSDELAKKSFTPNYVLQFKGQYFAARSPDSGLSVPSGNLGVVKSLTISPTQVDLKIATTTIANYSFILHDKGGVLTALFGNNPYLLTGEIVKIWVGRMTGSFDFSQYFQLPQGRIKTVTYNGDKTYTFNVVDQMDRMNGSIFSLQTVLPGSILSGTTTIQAPTTLDLSKWPTSGTMRVDDEFIGWTGVDLVAKQWTGCLRGLHGSTAADHDIGAQVFNVDVIQDNPVNILLQLMISKGGGGTYDVLDDGLAIDHSLIDVAGMEALRDTYFSGVQFKLFLYNIDTALTYIEDAILLPTNLRFAVSQDSKITVAILNRSAFNPDPTTIDNHTLTKLPKWTVDDNEVINQIQVSWDYDEPTGTFRQISTYSDSASIAQYGARPIQSYEFKGALASLSGQAYVDSWSSRLLARFAAPMPQIDVSAQMDTSLLTAGAKAWVKTDKLPSPNGDFNFNCELEVLSRAINFLTGDVTMKLMFTQYSNVRQGFIAPSHYIATVNSQSSITLSTGGGAFYRVGWPMRIFDKNAMDWLSDGLRTIQSIVGDTVTFTAPWSTTLIANQHRLTLPFYDETVAAQRVYAFMVDGVLEIFPDGSGPYQITF